MLRKIQIGSYFLMIINLFQLVIWVCRGYGKNGIIKISTPVFFGINIILPLIILFISFISAIFSTKKILSIIIIPMTFVQIAFFCFIILVGILLFYEKVPSLRKRGLGWVIKRYFHSKINPEFGNVNFLT